MQTLTLTGTDLFLGWLADADQELYSLFHNQTSVETYDKQESCVLHLFMENEAFPDNDRTALSNRWKEYCELFNIPVNKESLTDLSGTPLKEIFNKYSGQVPQVLSQVLQTIPLRPGIESLGQDQDLDLDQSLGQSYGH